MRQASCFPAAGWMSSILPPMDREATPTVSLLMLGALYDLSKRLGVVLGADQGQEMAKGFGDAFGMRCGSEQQSVL